MDSAESGLKPEAAGELRRYRDRILWWSGATLRGVLAVTLCIAVSAGDPWYAVALLAGAGASVLKFLLSVENVCAFAAAVPERRRNVYVGRGLLRYAVIAVILGVVAWASGGAPGYVLTAAGALFLTNAVMVAEAVVRARGAER